MAVVPIPTMEPPLCPDSDVSPDTLLNDAVAEPWYQLDLFSAVIAVVAIAVISFAALTWWQRKRKKQESSPTTQIIDQRLNAKTDFLHRVGDRYGYANSTKGFIDDWRLSEFPTLIPPLQLHHQTNQSFQNNPHNDHDSHQCIEQEVYLDYAGSAIPTQTLLSRMHDQSTQILANPHSLGGGLASDRTLKLIQLAKDRVMSHFGIEHEDFGMDELDKSNDDTFNRGEHENEVLQTQQCPGYQLVFTSGATESLRLIAERFPWSTAKITSNPNSRMVLSNSNGTMLTNQSLNDESTKHLLSRQLKRIQARSILVYPKNVHTSVIGIRECAMQQGAQFHCVSTEELQSATGEWFQRLIEESMSIEYHHGLKQMHDGTDDHQREEKKDDRCVASSIISRGSEQEDGNARSTSTTEEFKSIWMHHLLVLPLECNFGGDRFDWTHTTEMARKSCFSTNLYCSNEHSEQSTTTTIRICHKWHVLFDAAKAAATGPVNLPNMAYGGGPDFAVVSFYKMFGAPTGLGALIVKKQRRKRRRSEDRSGDSAINSPTSQSIIDCNSQLFAIDGITIERSTLPRHFFGGGSVDVVLPEEDFMLPRNSKGAASTLSISQMTNRICPIEDDTIDLSVMVHGTEHFRGIASLVHGFEDLDELSGMQVIHAHSTCLAAELVRRLSKLVHDSGKPVVNFYGQWKSFAQDTLVMDRDISVQNFPGPTVTFNLSYRDGSFIGYDEVSKLASLNRPPIQLRTGCFCNPGACQEALPLTNAEILENYSSGHVCGDRRGIMNGRLTGAIRASFGKDSIWEDMDALATFIERVFVSQTETMMPTLSPLEQEGGPNGSTLKIDSLFVFPIKSCAAMRVNRWPINRNTGRLAFDREFALVDTSGLAMRLHSYPKMSDIRSSIDLNSMTLTVSSLSYEDLILNLEPSEPSAETTMSPEDIQVCGNLCKGDIWGGSKASRWFSSVLGVRCWLARHHNTNKAEQQPYDGRQFAYCNEASLLLVSQQSISFLNTVIKTQGWGRLVESRHFRPNIVVSSKYQSENEDQGDANRHFLNPEDSWGQISIKGSTDVVKLNAVGKCARCQMVDVDPNSGMKGNTLRALAQYRRDRGKINFGTFFTGSAESSEETAWLEEGSEVLVSSNNAEEHDDDDGS